MNKLTSIPKKIFSPYRICPIGAHVDHQGGVMLGRTIRDGTTLTYFPSSDRQVHITSEQFGQASFHIDDDINPSHWIRYAQAAAHVLGDRLYRGMHAYVDGALSGAGLSSSASIGLAYLKALSDINEIVLSPSEMVQLDYQLENRHLGLMNDLLDPMTIVFGKKNAMLFIDATNASTMPIPDGDDNLGVWIVAYSGVSRELTKSGFNNTEVERVRKGVNAWEASDLELFGTLMNQSCYSSINNYQVGSTILIKLHEITSSTSGIYGSRFSGGGYAGCVIALAHRSTAENARQEIGERFSHQYPELSPYIFIAETGDGLQ